MRKIAFVLSLILIFAIPLEGIVTIPGFGSGTRLVGLMAVALWLPSVLMLGQIRQLHLLHLAVFSLFTWAAISILWSHDTASSLERIETFAQLAMLVALIWDIYDDHERIGWGLQAYVLGTLVATSLVVITFATDTDRSPYHPTRYMGSGFDPNAFGILLVLGVAIAWYLLNQRVQQSSPLIWCVVNFIYIPLGAFGALLTASRTAMFALFLVTAYILFSLRTQRISLRFAILVVLGSAFWNLQGYIPETTLGRLSKAGSSLASGDLTGRGEVWREGIVAFSDHPILGVGAGAFRAYIPSHMVSHNVALSFAAEIGIIGLTLYGFVLAIVVSCLVTIARYSRRDAFFWATLFMVWVFASLTLSWEIRKITWILFTLIASSSMLYRPATRTTQTPVCIERSETQAGAF